MWQQRQVSILGGGYHSGLDISTGTGIRGSNLYSICTGTVIGKGYQANGYGNYIIIKDNYSDYAFLFGHMYEPALKNIGETVQLGEQFGIEGATGNVTGLHTHVEMQNYVQNGNTWINNPSDPTLWRNCIFTCNWLHAVFLMNLEFQLYITEHLFHILKEKRLNLILFYLIEEKEECKNILLFLLTNKKIIYIIMLT